MELGKAKYGTGKKVFKLQDGDNVFRILPPMGKLAKSGKWHQYYRVEWGYKNSAGRNRPFQDPRVVNFNTKMVEVESAAHLRREALAAKLTELTAALRKDPTNGTLKQKHADMKEVVKRFNLDAKYYLNAIDLNGQIGLLKIGSRAFKALKAEIDKLLKQGVDPLSKDQGRFFNFNRSNDTGNFQDTAYQITVYQEHVEISGKRYKEDKVHQLDGSIISRLSDEAFELSGMYPLVTAAQVERMVNEGASAVDEILDSRDSNESSGDDTEDDTEDTSPEVSTTLVNSAAIVTKTTTPDMSISKTAVEAPATSTIQTPAVVTPSTSMNVDEFLKNIGAL